MRVIHASVTKLFETFDQEFDIPSDRAVTIIHGPNGVGKTVMLRMIDGVLKGEYSVFRSVPFETFSLTFSDGVVWRVSRTQVDGKSRVQISLFSSAQVESSQIYTVRPRPAAMSRRQLRVTAQKVADLAGLQRRADGWADRTTGEVISTQELMSRYGASLGLEPPSKGELPEWIKERRAQIPVHFMETQRLSPLEEDEDAMEQSTGSKIDVYAFRLARIIGMVLQAYGEKARELDRTFPTRIIAEPRSASMADLQLKLSRLQEKSLKLAALGVIDLSSTVQPLPDSAVPGKEDVFAVYARDVEDKLKVFDNLQSRLTLFVEIASRHLPFKTLQVSKESGFTIRTSSDLSAIPTSGLSSGEQHELVMLFEMLFVAEPGTLILIDEPEISLHVAWQQHFIADLLAVAKVTATYAVVATHSPEIIGEHWEWTQELKGPRLDGMKVSR